MSVTQKEICDNLRDLARHAGFLGSDLADRIEREGIAPPEVYAIVPELRIDSSNYSVGWNDCIRWIIQNAAAKESL